MTVFQYVIPLELKSRDRAASRCTMNVEDNQAENQPREITRSAPQASRGQENCSAKSKVPGLLRDLAGSPSGYIRPSTAFTL
jgi:hypothetical protein